MNGTVMLKKVESLLARGYMRVRVQQMFRGGQKPDGWFGCFATIYEYPHDRFRLTGVCADSVATDCYLLVKGKLTMSNGYEQVACSQVLLDVDDYNGIITFLSGRRFPRVGRVEAVRMYTAYGNMLLRKILEDPDGVRTKAGLSKDLMRDIVDGMRMRNVEQYLQQTLPTLSEKYLGRILRSYRGNVVNIIQEDPYRLLDAGVPFKIADGIALQALHMRPDAPERIGNGIVYVMKDLLNGDTYLNLSENDVFTSLYERTTELLGLQCDRVAFADMIRNACAKKASLLTLRVEKGENHLYRSDTYINELRITTFVNESHLVPLASDPSTAIVCYEGSRGKLLTDEQRNAVRTAAMNGLSCITGGPGRGKTFAIDCLAYVFRTRHVVSSASLRSHVGATVLLAPTGKAVRRLRQLRVCRDMDLPVYTIAKFLQIANANKYMFSSVEHFIVDEASMVSTDDMGQLMIHMQAYRRDGSRATLTLVGDVDQLPPVDVGCPFRDILTSGMTPVASLTANLRTDAPSIAENADRVRAGDVRLKSALTSDGAIESVLVPTGDDEASLKYVLNFYKTALLQNDLKDVAVLSPVNKGPVGVRALNITLQDLLNPSRQAVFTAVPSPGYPMARTRCDTRGASVPGLFYRESEENRTTVRVGDRVMLTKNCDSIEYFYVDRECMVNPDAVPTFDLMKPVVDRDSGVCNGDCGVVLDFTPADGNCLLAVTIGLDDGRIARVTEDFFEHVALAYAMTVHKAQGCEYDTVLYVSPRRLLSTPGGFASRNLVYTALTRAKSCMEIIGSKEALDRCILTPSADRHSMLKDRLNDVI